MSKKIEPTVAMILDAASTGTPSGTDARAILRAALNHPDARGLFADGDDRPWEPLSKDGPVYVGDEVRRDLHGITTTSVVARVDRNGDLWTAGGTFIGRREWGAWYVRRATQELPTEDGAVIVPAEGHEYIEASALHVTAAQYCREAVYEDPYYYGVWWRDGKAVHNGWRAENITPGTWKVADQ